MGHEIALSPRSYVAALRGRRGARRGNRVHALVWLIALWSLAVRRSWASSSAVKDASMPAGGPGEEPSEQKRPGPGRGLRLNQTAGTHDNGPAQKKRPVLAPNSGRL